jgi:hypothetical protein
MRRVSTVTLALRRFVAADRVCRLRRVPPVIVSFCRGGPFTFRAAGLVQRSQEARATWDAPSRVSR